MKVFVLMNYCGDEYEGDTNVVAIYSTLEKAIAAKAVEEKEDGDDYNQFWIDEWAVE